MSSLTNWIGQVALGYRYRAERRYMPGLAAFHANGRKAEPDKIRDISATGMYVETRARWPRNGMVSLWLQKSGPTDIPDSQRVPIRAQVVRRNENCVGLSFVLPMGMHLALWESPLKTSPDETRLDDVLREFQLAATIDFLSRICPEEETTICRLLRHELSNHRVVNAIDIAVRAEALLGTKPIPNRMRISPKLLLSILNDGSWASDEWRRQLWAGLLATCWSGKDTDGVNETLVHATSQLTVVHSKLLLLTCLKTTKNISKDGTVSALPFVCTTDEIITLTGTHDLHRIDCDLEHIAYLGLFVKREKTRFFVALDDTSMTPSTLGLDLFARSHGHCGPLADFYRTALTDFAVLDKTE